MFSNTEGLVFYANKTGEVELIKNLEGSIADDNIVVEMGVIIFLVPLLITLIRRKKQISLKESIVNLIFPVLQLKFLLSSIYFDCFYATIKSGNFILCLWSINMIIIFLISLIFVMLALFCDIRNKKENQTIKHRLISLIKENSIVLLILIVVIFSGLETNTLQKFRQNYTKGNYVILYNQSNWQPSIYEVEEGIKGLKEYLMAVVKNTGKSDYKKIENIVRNFDIYKIQCSGEIKNGRKIIHFNMFIGNFEKEWKNQKIVVKDGGNLFWNINYYIQQKKYEELCINGES